VLSTTSTFIGDNLTSDLEMPTLPPELMQGLKLPSSPQTESPGMGIELPSYNPLLD
jgi:hypothetical protein